MEPIVLRDLALEKYVLRSQERPNNDTPLLILSFSKNSLFLEKKQASELKDILEKYLNDEN